MMKWLLRRFWRTADREVNARWRRHLPFGDYVVDRWERARLLGFGEGTSIYGCVIGALSLVTSSVPAGHKAAGVPARIVGPVNASSHAEASS